MSKRKAKSTKKSPARMIATPTGPGRHWDKLSPEERSAIGLKAAETRRRNRANLVAQVNPQKDVTDYVTLLESIAMGATAAAALLRNHLRAL